jgi:hypothetical protein
MTVESRYPDVKARRKADAAVDALALSCTMLEYIVEWERVYLEAGGRVVL